MLIQTIDYKSNKIDRAYKNGVMIWHRLNLKYFGFDPVNVFLVNKNIIRTPFTKEMGLLNDKIQLMNQNDLRARASRRGSTFVGIGANIFDRLFSSQSRQISKEELISTLLFQSLFSSPAKGGVMEPGVETFINVLGASSRAVAQISQIFVDTAISSSFRQSKSQSIFINNLFLNQAIAFLEISPSIRYKIFLEIGEKSNVQQNVSPNKLLVIKNYCSQYFKVALKNQCARQIEFEQLSGIKSSSLFQNSKTSLTVTDNRVATFTHLVYTSSIRKVIQKSLSACLIEHGAFYADMPKSVQTYYLTKVQPSSRLNRDRVADSKIWTKIGLNNYFSLNAIQTIQEKLFNKIELEPDQTTLSKSGTQQWKIDNPLRFEGNFRFYQSSPVAVKIFKYISAGLEDGLLNISEGSKLFVSKKAVVKNLSLITTSVPDKLILVHSSNVLNDSDLIKGKILESALAAAQKIKNIGIFISDDVNRTLHTISIDILKESSQMSKSPIKPALLSYLLEFKSKILLLNEQEEVQYARLQTKIINYSILGMSTNLTTFESLAKILFCTKSVLIQQKLHSYIFKNFSSSYGYGILKFLSSHGGYCNFIFDFEDAFVNFGQYKKIGGVNNKIDTWQKSILNQVEILEFQNKKTHIKIPDNITLNIISYNILTQDFYYNIKHSLSTFFALSYYYYAKTGLHANFYNFAKLDFANDDEKWQYPVWKSEEEIFITQVFDFSYGNKEIK